MKKLLIFVMLSMPYFLFSQTIDWIRTAGDVLTDFGQVVRTDSAGNIYVSGTAQGTVNFGNDTVSSLDPFAFIAKYDSNGNNLWVYQYAAELSTMQVVDMELNSEGDIYTIGNIIADGESYGTIIKVSPQGTLLTRFTIAYSSNLQSLDIDSHGNYIAAGYFNGSLGGFLTFYDSTDNNLWEITFGGGGGSSCAQFTSDSYIYLTGVFQDTLPLVDFYNHDTLLQAPSVLDYNRFLARFDTTGRLQWAKTYSDNIPAIAMTLDKPSGAIYLLEQDDNYADYIGSFNAQGNENWTKAITGMHTIFAWAPHKLEIHNNSVYFMGGGAVVALLQGTVGLYVLNRFDLYGNLSGTLAAPYGTGITLIGGSLDFIGNSMVLTGGVIGSGTWGNQTITGDMTGFSNIFIAKMDETNITSPTGIGTPEGDFNWSIFPNPSDGEFIVSFMNESNSEAEISISDMVGRKVYMESLADGGQEINHLVNSGNLTSGVYLITLQTTGQISTKKIVIR